MAQFLQVKVLPRIFTAKIIMKYGQIEDLNGFSPAMIDRINFKPVLTNGL